MQPTATIKHPQKPEVAVIVQLPRGADRVKIRQARERATTRVQAVYDPEGKPVMSGSGEVQSLVLNVPLSPDAINAEISEYIVGMLNVPTLDGQVLNFPPERAKELAAERNRAIADGVLWDDHLTTRVSPVEMMQFIPEVKEFFARKPEEADSPKANELSIERPFALYLFDRCQQRSTFDSDPEGNSSRSS